MSPTPETYSRHTGHALRLLARFGGPATIARPGSTSDRGDCAFDPSGNDPDGNPCVQPSQSIDVTVLETGSTAEESSSRSGTILTVEFVGVMACPSDVTPTTDDRIVTDDGVLNVTELVAVGPAPGRASIVYELVASRS